MVMTIVVWPHHGGTFLRSTWDHGILVLELLARGMGATTNFFSHEISFLLEQFLELVKLFHSQVSLLINSSRKDAYVSTFPDLVSSKECFISF